MLSLVATCALGLEPFVADELRALGYEPRPERGAVGFRGGWRDAWIANLWLRTANRVLVVLGSWHAPDGDAIARGAGGAVASGAAWDGVTAGSLFHPERSFAIHATSSRSQVRDARWAALRAKDGIADAQRSRFGRRATVDREAPDLGLRLWLSRDQATLLLDTSGESLDHRGYRSRAVAAPVREQLAAAVVLASGWDRQGPVVDPMCGSATLLVEAGWIALGIAPGSLRREWAFERLPGFDERAWRRIRDAAPGSPAAALVGEVLGGGGGRPVVRLHGVDRDERALEVAHESLARAGLAPFAELLHGDAFGWQPPPGPGLVVVNPPYGERLALGDDSWKRLGDLLKQRYAGYRAAVLAGGEDAGKSLGLRPKRRVPVRNGPLDARILVLELYAGSRSA